MREHLRKHSKDILTKKERKRKRKNKKTHTKKVKERKEINLPNSSKQKKRGSSISKLVAVVSLLNGCIYSLSI